jgi:hypothetical protein
MHNIPVFRANIRHRLRVPFLALLALLFLGGCQAQLAPAYDQSIVQALGTANTNGMALFDQVAQNPSNPQGYAAAQASYTALIALLEATKVQIDSRPMPSTPSGANLLGKAISDIQAMPAPSSGVVALLAQTISTMRSTHATRALSLIEVQAFKGQYVISMQQALIYEKALAR